MPFFIGSGEFAELFRGVIALAIIQIGGQVRVQRDFDAPEFSVLSRIAGVIPQDVVARNGLLRLDDSPGQVVIVEQSLSAGIPGERIKRVLRLLKARC